MRTTILRAPASLSLAAVLALGLSACGGDDTAGTAGATPSSEATSATDEPTDEPTEEPTDEPSTSEPDPGSDEESDEESGTDPSQDPSQDPGDSEPADSEPGTTGSPDTTSPEGEQSAPGTPSPSPTTPAATGDDRVFPGGKPLRAYRDDPTYPWRVNVLDAEGDLVPAMQRVASGLSRAQLEQVIATCESLVTGVSGQQLVRQTRQRFSGPADIGVRQARRLIDLSGQYGCPQ